MYTFIYFKDLIRISSCTFQSMAHFDTNLALIVFEKYIVLLYHWINKTVFAVQNIDSPVQNYQNQYKFSKC